MSKTYYPDQTRNLNPTLEAKVAMIIYGEAYSRQSGGSMDFWDSLNPMQKKRCTMVIDLVSNDPETSNNIHKSAPVRRLKGE